ncbi:MAG: hypothetical protein Q7T82_02180 [Armatimonadota bacterium]|nr:hypothetical protein [Armatimonadota bacterium]
MPFHLRYSSNQGGVFSSRVSRGALSALAALLLICVGCAAASSSTCSASDFFANVTGEWIGVCEQTTDGEKAIDKFFHASITRTGDNTFESRFEYFRADSKTGAPVRAGESIVVTTVAADGTASSKITGKGSVLVYNSPKTQEHQLAEVARATGPANLRSEGKGSIRVNGMPLGLGKNGRVYDSKSQWAICNGSLTIRQNLKVGFRALFLKKTFDVTASYTARRGSDVASVMTGRPRVSSQPSHAAFR